MSKTAHETSLTLEESAGIASDSTLAFTFVFAFTSWSYSFTTSGTSARSEVRGSQESLSGGNPTHRTRFIGVFCTGLERRGECRSAYRRDQQYPACRDVHGYAQPPNVDTYRYQSAGEDRRAEMVFGMTRAARKEPVVDVSVAERLCLVEQLMDFVDTTYIWYAMLRRVLRGSARMLRWRQLG